MKKKSVIPFCILLFLSVGLFGQSSNLIQVYEGAKTNFFEGNYTESRRLLEEAIEINGGASPNESYLIKALGLIFLEEAKFDSAEVCFKYVLSLDELVYEKDFEEQVDILIKKAATQSAIRSHENHLKFWTDLVSYDFPFKSDKPPFQASSSLFENPENKADDFIFILLLVLLVPILLVWFIRQELKKRRTPYFQQNKKITLEDEQILRAGDIFYIMSSGNYLDIYFSKKENENGSTKLERLVVRGTIKDMAAQLPQPLFISSSRSAIINILKFKPNLSEEEGNSIIDKYGLAITIPVPKGKVKEVFKQLADWDDADSDEE
jgi:tetratricopeptide (TPR) repeat protein